MKEKAIKRGIFKGDSLFLAISTCYSDGDNYLLRKFKGDSKMKKKQ